MDRRAFIRSVCGGFLAVPLAARAQQPAMRVIGFLHGASPNVRHMAAFQQGLKEAGFVEGQNVAIEYRWAEGRFDRLPELANDPDAVFVAPDSFYNTRREQLSKLAARHAIPAVYSVRDYVEAGGLMSYGPNIAEMYRRVGAYTGKILSGKKPEDLPVEQVAKFELAINVQTAKALGLTIPPSLLLRADDVIQ